MNAVGVTLTAAATAFDRVASSYDAQFTHTAIGRAQRKQVWRALLDAFPVGSRILELNCGTGEDARFLASRGRSVVACDASPAMIDIAWRSWRGAADRVAVEYRQLSNEELASLSEKNSFDGAFSNFSGLNCLADLGPFARNLADLVRPSGRVLFCLWSPACAVEVLWYLLCRQPRKALRRFRTNSVARLGGVAFPVTYHGFRDVRRSFSPWFELSSRRAIGLFVPPSYAEPWMNRHHRALARCEQLDHLCAGWPVFRGLGDHMLLEFVRCNR
jgi:SAM-dependent methyltransferase